MLASHIFFIASLLVTTGCERPSNSSRLPDGSPIQDDTQYPNVPPQNPSPITSSTQVPPAQTPDPKTMSNPPFSPVVTPLGHPPTDKEATNAFLQFWRTEMHKPGSPPDVASLDNLVNGQKPSVTLRTCTEYHRLVTDRIGSSEPNPNVLFGSLQGLKRQGKCWDIHFDGLVGGGLGASVDAKDGGVIFIWQTPEG